MPTLPSEPHQYRDVAESFGAVAERYDRTRPSYPQTLVARIAEAGPAVLDVGCGTGIAARQFQAAGCEVLGVEVDERMAHLARRAGIEVEVSAFEAWDPAGRLFDVVAAGQTWHWIDPVAGTAKAAQALRPGGRLAVFWNVFDTPPDLAEAFAESYRRVAPEMPVQGRLLPGLAVYSTMFAKAAEGIEQTAAFTGTEQWRYDWSRPYTRDEWLELVPTFGGHSRLAPGELAELLTEIGTAIDKVGGSFTMGYNAVAVTATRTG